MPRRRRDRLRRCRQIDPDRQIDRASSQSESESGRVGRDPQSPLSGGALLGDRFRMSSQPDDDGVFIRSLAALSGRGAIADHVDVMIRLLETFGFELVLVETVGAGQGDTAVHALADTVLLLVQPETGDDLQWEKAGIFEVADVVVVHKADLPGADRAAAQVRASLDLSSQSQVPVLRVSSRTGEGMETLWQTLLTQPRRRPAPVESDAEVLEEAQALLARRFVQAREDARLQEILARWHRGSLSRAEAA